MLIVFLIPTDPAASSRRYDKQVYRWPVVPRRGERVELPDDPMHQGSAGRRYYVVEVAYTPATTMVAPPAPAGVIAQISQTDVLITVVLSLTPPESS